MWSVDRLKCKYREISVVLLLAILSTACGSPQASANSLDASPTPQNPDPSMTPSPSTLYTADIPTSIPTMQESVMYMSTPSVFDCSTELLLPEEFISPDQIEKAPKIVNVDFGSDNIGVVRIVQQPEGDNGYVNSNLNVLTQFWLAQEFGVIGLLGHNWSGGALFYNLEEGEKFTITTNTDQQFIYQVEDALCFQAITPESKYSDFVQVGKNLEPIGNVLPVEDIFKIIYFGGSISGKDNQNFVGQTCITKDGNAAWGRLFIRAKRVN